MTLHKECSQSINNRSRPSLHLLYWTAWTFFCKKKLKPLFQRKYLHNNNVYMYIFVVVNVQPTRWSNGRWKIFSIYVYSMCQFKQDFKMDIFGQKLPLNGMIRAKEGWCFGTLLHVYVSFLFLHQTTRLIKYTTNVMIDVAKKGRRNKFAWIRISCSLWSCPKKPK